MKRTTEAYDGGAAWGLFDFMAEVLALPLGLIMAPFVATGRAFTHVGNRGRLSALSWEVALTRRQMKMESKRVNDFLRDHLEAMEQLQTRFLNTRLLTSEDVQRAYELLQLATELELERARAQVRELLGGGADPGSSVPPGLSGIPSPQPKAGGPAGMENQRGRVA